MVVAGQVIDVVKRGRRSTEAFERDKLHSSIVAACLSVQTPIRQAEQIADAVCTGVIDWLQTRPEVTSNDLRHTAAKHLTIHHPDAAYLYEQYSIIL